MLSQPDPIRVVIADGHGMLRQGLSIYLERDERLQLVGEACDARGSIDLCRRVRPDVIITDIVLPGMDGIEMIRRLHRLCAGINIVILTSILDRPLVRAAVKEGITSYLLKNITADDLCMMIHWASRGRTGFSPEVTQVIAEVMRGETVDSPSLTERQLDVLHLLVDGRTNAQIALALDLSVPTVKKHVSGILNRLDVCSRTEAVALAIQNGIMNDALTA